MSQGIGKAAAARVLALHFSRHLRGIQFALKAHFGQDAKGEHGECAILITPGKIDLTNEACTIVARGPAKVATVLVRKRKRK